MTQLWIIIRESAFSLTKYIKPTTAVLNMFWLVPKEKPLGAKKILAFVGMLMRYLQLSLNAFVVKTSLNETKFEWLSFFHWSTNTIDLAFTSRKPANTNERSVRTKRSCQSLGDWAWVLKNNGWYDMFFARIKDLVQSWRFESYCSPFIRADSANVFRQMRMCKKAHLFRENEVYCSNRKNAVIVKLNRHPKQTIRAICLSKNWDSNLNSAFYINLSLSFSFVVNKLQSTMRKGVKMLFKCFLGPFPFVHS